MVEGRIMHELKASALSAPRPLLRCLSALTSPIMRGHMIQKVYVLYLMHTKA